MTKTIKIICDGCAKNISARAKQDRRIVLTCDVARGIGAFGRRPEEDSLYHFCDLQCLDFWRRRDRAAASLWAKWRQKLRDEGTVEEPTPEEMDKRVAEFHLASLESYPMKPWDEREATA